MTKPVASVLSLCLPPQPGEPRSWDGSLDTGEVLRQADRLGAFPAVYNSLRALRPGAPVAPEWEERFRDNFAHNLRLRHEERRVVDHLTEGGVDCRPIKGVGLVELLYPDLSWRAMADIDLLAPPAQVKAAYLILKQAGLEDAAEPWHPRSLARQLSQPPHAFAELVLRGRHDVIVELHWDWFGETFPAHNPAADHEAFLLYLSIHSAKHLWSSLQMVSDLELYLRRVADHLDWDRFWRLARGWERVCAAGFQVCSELVQRPLRAEEAMRATSSSRRLARRATELLLGETKPWWWRWPALQRLRVYTWRQRVSRCLLWMAPPPWHWNERPEASDAAVWFRRYRRLLAQLLAPLIPSAGWRRRLRKAADLSACDWLLLARAFALLSVVRAGMATVGFDRLQRWATRVRTGVAEPPRRTVRHTAWLVDVAANLYPVPMLCLARSLTLLRLLARCGVSAELKLGVRMEGDQLHAHAWVEWQGEPVNASRPGAAQYAALAATAGSPRAT